MNEKNIFWSKKKRGPRKEYLDISSREWSKRKVGRKNKGGRATRVRALETEVSFKRKIWLTKSNAAQQSSQMMSVERVEFDSEQVIIKLERTGSVE